MLRFIYLYRNLTRNLLRTMLTCAAVVLPIVIYVLSTAVIDGFEKFLENSAKQLRLAVTSKTSLINPLPEGYRRKMESLDPDKKGLLSVCGLRYIGGQREDDPMPLSTLGVDVDTFPATFPEHRLTPAEIEAWNRDKQALLVGRGTALDMGWKTGDRVSFMPSVPPFTPMEFHVVSTMEHAEDFITNWCRRDYVEEEVKKADHPEGLVTFFFVKCATKADLERYRGLIDKLFTGQPDETRTVDEKTFMNEFITQQFDLPRNLKILSALTVLVAVMAAANTMSMNFRDRTNEIATLRSLGFGPGFGFALIQSESLLLCALGGFLGAAIPYLAFTYSPLREVTIPVIQTMEISLATCGKAIIIALFIGVVAGLWPSWLAMRMHVVKALRTFE